MPPTLHGMTLHVACSRGPPLTRARPLACTPCEPHDGEIASSAIAFVSTGTKTGSKTPGGAGSLYRDRFIQDFPCSYKGPLIRFSVSVDSGVRTVACCVCAECRDV